MLPGLSFWFSRAFSSLNKNWCSANKRLWLSKVLFFMWASRAYFKCQKAELWLFYSDSFSSHSGFTNTNSSRGNSSDFLGERSSGKSVARKVQRLTFQDTLLYKKYCDVGHSSPPPWPHPGKWAGQDVLAESTRAESRGESRFISIIKVLNDNY